MNELVPSLKETIFHPCKDEIGDLTEVFIDSVLDEGLFRDLPVVGTITGLIKVTKSIIHRNLLKQTLQFIKEFNNGTIDEDKLLKYKEMLDNNNDKAEEELGRVLIILNGTIDLEKSKMLANLFRNYINEVLSWNEFCEFCEIVRMLQINDIKILKNIYSRKLKDTTKMPLYPFNRLYALGLINTTPKGLYPIDPDGSYVRTENFVSLSRIGGKFYNTINL